MIICFFLIYPVCTRLKKIKKMMKIKKVFGFKHGSLNDSGAAADPSVSGVQGFRRL